MNGSEHLPDWNSCKGLFGGTVLAPACHVDVMAPARLDDFPNGRLSVAVGNQHVPEPLKCAAGTDKATQLMERVTNVEQRGVDLAIELRQHLFDTCYQRVAPRLRTAYFLQLTSAMCFA